MVNSEKGEEMREQIFQKVFGDLEKARIEKRREARKKYRMSEKGKRVEREVAKRYYERHKEKFREWARQYRKKYIVDKWEKIGKVICPKCNKEGYAYKVTRLNKKTGKSYGRMFIIHKEKMCSDRWIKNEVKNCNVS
jgi:hypothetical protein